MHNIYFFIVIRGASPAPPPEPLPNILYQLLTSAPPSPFPDVLPMSDRDARDGYVHLARALNILPLAMKNYNYTLQLWALKLNYKWMRENQYDIRWEWGSSNTTIYPHLYDNTTKQMLLDMKTWTRKDNEKWNQTSVVDDEWLTDGNTGSAASFKLGTIERTVFQLLCAALSFYSISF
ncbi:unnamed protein product [Rotaria sordida]|uniref:Uncharacterized protein n=1 Tax=Rotaria sordida TaxID=392033 RepID=A0A814Z114_9BILA|nr:unnamed protein product [Rotaria sordida]CAF1519616.1 unnamed protein product [Rotaria sordida]